MYNKMGNSIICRYNIIKSKKNVIYNKNENYCYEQQVILKIKLYLIL